MSAHDYVSSGAAYLLPRLFDRRCPYRSVLWLLWSAGWAFSTFTLSPMFIDLFMRMPIRSAIPGWEVWGPVPAGILLGWFVFGLAALFGWLAGENGRAWTGKVMLVALALGLSVVIGAVRYKQARHDLEAEWKAAHEAARADLLAARALPKTSAEAVQANADIKAGRARVDEMKDVKRDTPHTRGTRRMGMKLIREGKAALAEVKETAKFRELEAQGRLDVLGPLPAITFDQVFDQVAVAVAGEFMLSEFAIAWAFVLGILSATPMLLRTREEHLVMRRPSSKVPAAAAPVETGSPDPEAAQPTVTPEPLPEGEEDDEEDDDPAPEPTIPVHPMLKDCDPAHWDEATRLGMDMVTGAWLEILPGPPEMRRTVDKAGKRNGAKRLYPTLVMRTNRDRAIYPGTVRAIRAAIELRDKGELLEDTIKALDAILDLPAFAGRWPKSTQTNGEVKPGPDSEAEA